MASYSNSKSKNKKVDQVKMGRPKKKFTKNKPKKRKIDSVITKKENESRRLLSRADKNNIPANNENSIIFEQIRKNYTNRSVVKNIDTAFSYYKFPPTTKLNVADFSIPDQNIDILENVQKSLEKDAPDNISGYHQIPISVYPKLGEGQYKRTSVRWQSTWNIYEKNGTGWGEGKRAAPFFQTIYGQPLIDGKFYLTPDIIKSCQEQGKVIKFKIQFRFQMKGSDEATMRLRYAAGKPEVKYNPPPVEGVPYPYDYDTEFNIWLSRRSAVSGWHYDSPTGNDGKSIYDAHGRVQASINYRRYREYRGRQWAIDNPGNKNQSIPCNLHYIIDPRVMKEFDYWEVETNGSNGGYYLTNACYWEVQFIDDPGKGVADYDQRSKYYGKQVILPKKKYGGYDIRTQDLLPAIGPGSPNKEQLAKNAAAAAKAAREKKAKEDAAYRVWQDRESKRIAAVKASLAAKAAAAKAALDKVFKDKGNTEADKATGESSFTSTIQPNPLSQAELDAIKAKQAAQIKAILDKLPFGKKGG